MIVGSSSVAKKWDTCNSPAPLLSLHAQAFTFFSYDCAKPRFFHHAGRRRSTGFFDRFVILIGGRQASQRHRG